MVAGGSRAVHTSPCPGSQASCWRLHRTRQVAASAHNRSALQDFEEADVDNARSLQHEVLTYNAQCVLMDKTKSSSVGEALRKDFLAWEQLGSLRGHQEQQWSKSTAKSAVVNCTMLPPFETPVSRWTAHYDQQFIRAWAPLELHELQAVARPDQLASALQAAATAARASPAVEEAPLPGPWGAFPPCPAPPVDKAGARP
ncbi:hypothetical protein HaLaN_00278, partial [Haematococcus lacustris]